MTLNSSSILPFLASAITFFLLNTIITDVAVAMSSGVVMGPYIAKDLVFQAQATLPLLALAPVVVAAVDESLWLIPLAAAPAVALWWGTRLALENARLAQELQRSLEQEQELNRMKDDFVAMVSHELRTPLTSIQGYIKTLRQLSSDLPPDQRESFLEAADRQGDRLRRLIEQLLVVGRLETHVEPLAVTPISSIVSPPTSWTNCGWGPGAMCSTFGSIRTCPGSDPMRARCTRSCRTSSRTP